MSASDTFESADKFIARLKSLRKDRCRKKLARRNKVNRRSLTAAERQEILQKTGGYCHLCGGLIEGKWQADHVFSHALGGKHHVNNFLPAHSTCNKYRWFYGPEEFQWVLKLGGWLRTEIERGSNVGCEVAGIFIAKDQKRHARRKQI